MEDDSDYSGDDVDIKDGIKGVGVLLAKNSQLEYKDCVTTDVMRALGWYQAAEWCREVA